MIRFHRYKFLVMAIGVLALITSNVAKNVIHFKGRSEDMDGLADILGWIALAVIAFSVAMHPRGGLSVSVWAVLPFLAVLGYAVGQRLYMRDGIQNAGQVIFALSLFTLGGLLGDTPGALLLGFSGALLVAVGSLFAIPWQKTYAMVDGPGGYMVSLGWLLMIFGNSLFREGVKK